LRDKIAIAFGLFWNPSIDNELTHIIKKYRPDIAHFNNIYPLIGATAYQTCHKFNIPIVQSIHNYRFMCPGILFHQNNICEQCVDKRFFWPAIIHGCYRSSHLASFFYTFAFYLHRYILNSFSKINICLFPSEFTKKYYDLHFSIFRKKGVILPHFINIKSSSAKRHNNYFLFVGRLSEEKGIIPLLEIFKKLPLIKLYVVGDGPLRKQVDQYKKYKNIFIKGFLFRNIIFSYIKNALMIIIPSLWYEVSPLVLTEAYANNTPVIVPDIGVFKEKVISGKTGIFYNYGDMRDLKNKIIGIHNQVIPIKSFAKNILQIYKNEYNSTKYYQQLLSIYHSLIKK
jgi:glycosyltransferase involved in cell wall biosynthesis